MKSLQTERFQCMSPKFSFPTEQLGNCPCPTSGLSRPTKGNKCALSGMTMSWYSTSWIPALVTQKLKKMGPPGAVASHYLQMLPALVSVVRRFFGQRSYQQKSGSFQYVNFPISGNLGLYNQRSSINFGWNFRKKKHPTNKQNKTKQSKAKQSKAQQNKQTTNQPTKQTKQTNKKHLKTNPSQQEFLGPLFWGWMKNSIGSELNQPLRCWETLTWTTTGGHATLQTSGEGRKEGINDGWWIKPQVVQPEFGNYTKQSSDVDDVASQIIRCFMMVVAGFTYPRTLLIGIRFPNNKFGKV